MTFPLYGKPYLNVGGIKNGILSLKFIYATQKQRNHPQATAYTLCNGVDQKREAILILQLQLIFRALSPLLH